jgi:hypothetical protein
VGASLSCESCVQGKPSRNSRSCKSPSVLEELLRRVRESTVFPMLTPLARLKLVRLAIGDAFGRGALAGSAGQLSSSSTDNVSAEEVGGAWTRFCQACARVAAVGAGGSGALITLLFLVLDLELERSTVRNSGTFLDTPFCFSETKEGTLTGKSPPPT